MKTFFYLLSFILSATYAYPQEFKPDHIMYGVAYYDVYMPEDRLEQDIELMKECGINTVRIGESTWSQWEPADGVFDFSDLDRMLDAFHDAGIQVIVGTPTYAIPQWMAKKHPEMMVTHFSGQVPYGGRQNMDITNPDYLRYAGRIIRNLIGHCAGHPAVIGFQLDNETKSYQTASTYAKQQFIEHLKAKFGTTDSLNRTWNLYYWSQSIKNWEDLHVSGSMANQAINLEWSRFQQELATNFLLWQRKIVDEYKKPHQFVTQNFDYYWKDGSVGPQPAVDHYAAARALDIASTDIYHKIQDQFDGVMIAFGGDNTRGLKNSNYFVMETNCQSATWHSDKIFIPYDGQLRQAFYAHLASGANMVAYWPWHNIHNAGETYWKGILGHDLQPNRGFNEVKKISEEVSRIQDKLISLRKQNDVAILYSIDSFHALEIKKISTEIDYAEIFMQIYEAFYKNNIETDIITPHNFEPEKYKLVVIPPLLVCTDEMLKKMDTYVKGGGHILMFYKSGYADENYNMRPVTMPGILRDACGFSYQDYTNTTVRVPLKGNTFKADPGEYYAGTFMELLVPEGCDVLASYDHKHWGKYAAITRNSYEKGSLTYVGTLVSDLLMQQIAMNAAQKANVLTGVNQYSFPVIFKSGKNQQGKTIRYVFNFSDETKSILYPAGTGVNLLNGEKIEKGGSVAVGAWDLLIVEEE
jgi:beta-galactosidase